jgi:striatin 1/3/4
MAKAPNEMSGSAAEYNWAGVLDFLYEQQRLKTEKETEWLLEKQELQTRIATLEGENKAQENINRDLLKRIKMLEYALRQERLKYSKLSGGTVPDELLQAKLDAATSSASLAFPSMQRDPREGPSDPLVANPEPEVQIAKRRAQSHRQMLKK